MKLKKAIELMEYHQRWRKSKEDKMLKPKHITKAIDVLIKKAKTLI